jgi:hypothetical protein
MGVALLPLVIHAGKTTMSNPDDSSDWTAPAVVLKIAFICCLLLPVVSKKEYPGTGMLQAIALQAQSPPPQEMA